MFYSHTFLARKGPLGTVWCAAHLQHKLKKSHYTSTHIPSTVERIMCPEVPIALRMSGHLLLGVVRIYSKKVDYLHHDCSVLCNTLSNTFRRVNVNLPENAIHAQPSAVTLPETFQLDALDVDLHLSLDHHWTHDNHLKPIEEITLQDQNPFEGDVYVRITLDDDITPDLSRSESSPPRDKDSMQTDLPPQDQSLGSLRNLDVGPSMQSEEGHERFGDGSSLPDIPMDIETLRDFSGNENPFLQPDVILASEPNESPLKMPENEPESPSVEHRHMSGPEVPMPHSPQRSGPSSHPTAGDHMFSGSFVNASLEDLELRPSPTPEPPPRPQRKRKQLFDESLVLTNEFLKKALNDCSNLVKKRKKLPCSSLELWRFYNSRKKEQIFSEPLITGMCADLQNLSSKDLSSSKLESEIPQSPTIPIVVVVNEGVRSPDRDRDPDFDAQPDRFRSPAHDRVFDFDAQPERLRSADVDPGHNFRPELISPLPLTPPHSQETAHNFSSPRIPDSVSEQSGTVIDTEPHGGGGMFSSRTGSEIITPVTDFDGRINDFSMGLSDIPELRNSMPSDGLSFLEQDNDSPPDSMGPREGGSMSVRTRAVAQFLRDHSPLSKYSDRSTEDISLNNILEGRTRKLCARMFYETLVLKDYGLIDVQQDEPYGDITLKLTPTFSTAKI